MLFCLIIFLLTLIGENQVVVTGARAGLMLWFHAVSYTHLTLPTNSRV